MDAGSAVEERGLAGVDRLKEEARVSTETKVDDVSARVRVIAVHPQRDDRSNAVGELVG